MTEFVFQWNDTIVAVALRNWVTWLVVLLELGSLWMIFEKASYPGWTALVPFYNVVAFCNLSGLPGWLSLAMVLPLAGTLFLPAYSRAWAVSCALLSLGLLAALYRLAARFRCSGAFRAGLVVLPIVFLPILAFGSADYVAPGGRGRKIEYW